MRWLAHAQKNPKLSEGFQQGTFKGQVREGHANLVVANFLKSESFVLAAVHICQVTIFR